jgi:hypothetical protein
MAIDVAVLATTVVTSFLLPYVKMGAEKLAEEVTKKASQAAADHVIGVAKKVWNRMTKVFSSEKEQNTLEYFKDDPEAFQAAVEKMLREKLEKDSKLAQELDELVNAESPDGKGTGAQIMNAAIAGIVDLRGAHISGSGHDIRGVSIGPSPTPPWPPVPEEKT